MGAALMAGTFQQRMAELEERVGHGDLVGRVEVNQVYALAQHSGFWRTGPLAGVVIRNHPRGGKSHFLSDPLHANYRHYMENLAVRALEPEGLHGAMRANVEDLAQHVYDEAPREEDVLRDSALVQVLDRGRIVFERPAPQPRRAE